MYSSDIGLWLAKLALYALSFCFGCVLGSFCGVVIYRLPRGLGIARGRSVCPKCGVTLEARDLFPLISWLALKGKCRRCGGEISLRHPIIEVIGGLSAAFALAEYSYSVMFFAACALLLILLVIAFIDWDTMEIPPALNLCLCVPAVVMAALPGQRLEAHLIGALAVSLPLLVLSRVVQGSFGGGDIKLMAVCGLALGWKLILLAFFIALLSGGGYCAVMLAKRRLGTKAHIPFGPFLAFGAAISLLWGDAILGLYITAFFA